MKHAFAQYIKTTLIFFCLDMIWLLGIAHPLYQSQLRHLLSESPNIWAAGLFYLLFPIGIIVFAIRPTVHSRNRSHTLALGALFGFLSYAAYDLTNLATLRNWPLGITVIDIVWGTLLTATTAAIVTKLGDKSARL